MVRNAPKNPTGETSSEAETPVVAATDVEASSPKEPDYVNSLKDLAGEKKPVETPKFEPAPLCNECKQILSDMKGRYRYDGPMSSFQCREGREFHLLPGRKYEAKDLPKHEIIAIAYKRDLFVQIPAEAEAEAKTEGAK